MRGGRPSDRDRSSGAVKLLDGSGERQGSGRGRIANSARTPSSETLDGTMPLAGWVGPLRWERGSGRALSGCRRTTTHLSRGV
jgi:hypothetical protein